MPPPHAGVLLGLASLLAAVLLAPPVFALPADPIFGGELSLDGSFEGDLLENCTGEDGATSDFPSTVQDCDFTQDQETPDGLQVMREVPGGLSGGHSWDNAFATSASEIWVLLWIKVVADAPSFNNLFCLTSEDALNLFHCLDMNVGESQALRIVAGGTNCDFANMRAPGEWCHYLMHADTTTGDVELWCDCAGTASGCSDDLASDLPDAVCDGTPDLGQAFEGFVLYGTADPIAEWRIDDIEVYDVDPLPEPGGLGLLAGIALLWVLGGRSRGASPGLGGCAGDPGAPRASSARLRASDAL